MQSTTTAMVDLWQQITHGDEPVLTDTLEKTRQVGPEANRVAMTVRLDPQRHRQLKVFSAHTGISCQDIMVRAMDKFLNQPKFAEQLDGQAFLSAKE